MILSDIAEVIMGQAPPGDSYNENNDGLPLLAGASDLGPELPSPSRFTSAAKKISEDGDIILCVRATIGKLNWSDGQYCLGRGVSGIRTRSKADSEFLYYYLAANERHLQSKGRGATFKQISKTDISELEISEDAYENRFSLVSQIQECLSRVEEIGSLLKAQESEFRELKTALVFGEPGESTQWGSVREFTSWIQDPERVQKGGTYRFCGMRSFGRGPFLSGERSTDDFRYEQLRRLKTRDFIYPKLMAWEGAFGMIPDSLDGTVVSPEFVVFRTDESRMLPEVFDTYFRSPFCLREVNAASTGSNRRRRRLNPKAFLNLRVPVPPMERQKQLRDVYRLESEMIGDIEDTRAELKALRNAILRQAFAGEL